MFLLEVEENYKMSERPDSAFLLERSLTFVTCPRIIWLDRRSRQRRRRVPVRIEMVAAEIRYNLLRVINDI